MGSGKTTMAIKEINQNPERKYIVIVKYLSEVKRIIDSCKAAKFFQPSDKYGKQTSFYELLKDGKNIVMTHELYKRLSITKIHLERIRDNSYRLLIDEVAEVIEPINVTEKDRDTILEKYAAVEEDGRVRWTDNEYKGDHDWIKRKIESKSVVLFKDKMFLWLLPIELIMAFKYITIMTFLFEGSHMAAYLRIHDLSYSMMYIDGDAAVEGKQDLTSILPEIKKLIDIYEGDLNDIGDDDYSLSKSWYINRKNRNKAWVVECNTRNYLKNICDATAPEMMWTKFKDVNKQHRTPNIAGRYYSTAFCPCNASATNEYRERNYLAYLINVYENPMIMTWFDECGVRLNQDAFALSQLMQWIWRSAIREGNRISIYIPSRRMRNLLKHFLETGEIYSSCAA